jgi:hypothetical protein
MKNASLLLSTALASLIVLAPATLTSADAATIKIKPQVVKVKPKIAVAKPKLRLKVKAARVRVTPKLRVKVKPKIAIAKPKLRVKVKPRIKAANIKPRVKVKAKAPKIVTTLKATPKIAAPALNIKPRIKVQAVAKAIGKVKPAAIIKPQVKVASTPPKATIRQTGAAAVVDRVVIPSGISDAAQGARAAAAARDAIKLGAIGAAVATGKLGSELGALDIASRTVRTNAETNRGMFRQPAAGSPGQPALGDKWATTVLAGSMPTISLGFPAATARLAPIPTRQPVARWPTGTASAIAALQARLLVWRARATRERKMFLTTIARKQQLTLTVPSEPPKSWVRPGS